MGESGSGRVLWWRLLAVVVVAVLQTEGAKIYTPDTLHEIAQDIAIMKCLRDPTCVLPSHLKQGHRCKVGGEMMNEIMKETKMEVTTRSGGGGGGGGCNKMTGEVVWPETGECVTLLTQGPCPPGQWVKLKKTTFKPTCQPQPCTLPRIEGGRPGRSGEGAGVMVGGKCYPHSQLPRHLKCPPNQKAITNEYGEVECDCRPGFVYYEGDNSCYEPYTRGPCAFGYTIQVEDTEVNGRARCFPNLCPEDRMVRMNASCYVEDSTHFSTSHNANCYAIGTEGPCEAGVITVDSSLAVPICLTTHSIFTNVVMRCSRGTRRDLLGRCRSTYDSILSSLPLFSTRRPGIRGCPPGEFFAGGTCIKRTG